MSTIHNQGKEQMCTVSPENAEEGGVVSSICASKKDSQRVMGPQENKSARKKKSRFQHLMGWPVSSKSHFTQTHT